MYQGTLDELLQQQQTFLLNTPFKGHQYGGVRFCLLPSSIRGTNYQANCCHFQNASQPTTFVGSAAIKSLLFWFLADALGSCCTRNELLFASIRPIISVTIVTYVENCERAKVLHTSKGVSCGMTFSAVISGPHFLDIASPMPSTHINVPGVLSTAVT